MEILVTLETLDQREERENQVLRDPPDRLVCLVVTEKVVEQENQEMMVVPALPAPQEILDAMAPQEEQDRLEKTVILDPLVPPASQESMARTESLVTRARLVPLAPPEMMVDQDELGSPGFQAILGLLAHGASQDAWDCLERMEAVVLPAPLAQTEPPALKAGQAKWVMKVPRVPPDHQDLKAERDGLD